MVPCSSSSEKKEKKKKRQAKKGRQAAGGGGGGGGGGTFGLLPASASAPASEIRSSSPVRYDPSIAIYSSLFSDDNDGHSWLESLYDLPGRLRSQK